MQMDRKSIVENRENEKKDGGGPLEWFTRGQLRKRDEYLWTLVETGLETKKIEIPKGINF